MTEACIEPEGGDEMIQRLASIADGLLDRVVPKATASAFDCYYLSCCKCYGSCYRGRKYCCGGACGGCTNLYTVC